MLRVEVLLAAVLVATASWAAPKNPTAPTHEPERPWARGVSQEDQQAALKLFAEGNALLKDSVFVQAAAKYREALKHWDHPAIHYNLVLALLNLDQPVEVHQHLEAAMKYGPAPLDADKFEQARAYKILIEKQLARIVVTCEVEGANVVMDGRPLFVAPGRYEGLVRAGPHTIVATREGYLTNETSPNLVSGKTTTIDLQLYTSESLTQYRRRWAVWMPWTVVAAGAAVAAGGAVLHQQARESFATYDQSINTCGGCYPGDDVRAALQRGNSQQTLALVGYAVGGAAIAAGATLVYFNRLEPYQVRPEDLQVNPEVTVVPMVGPHEGGVFATVRF